MSAQGEIPGPIWAGERGGWTDMICDYNGWNDAPEEEREWFDQHPEIWGGANRENELRPYRVNRTRPSPRPKGDMAA